MSCRRKTTVLRIPASALGMKFRWEWDLFLKEHDDDFSWEPGRFGESMCDDFPSILGWTEANFHFRDRLLGQRNPVYPDIVPGPFLDYFLEDIVPFCPESNSYGSNDEVRLLSESQMKEYLPVYRTLFPNFTLKDMEAVRWCKFEWYDGANAIYLYSNWDTDTE